jgi:hypothetical protein
MTSLSYLRFSNFTEFTDYLRSKAKRRVYHPEVMHEQAKCQCFTCRKEDRPSINGDEFVLATDSPGLKLLPYIVGHPRNEVLGHRYLSADTPAEKVGKLAEDTFPPVCFTPPRRASTKKPVGRARPKSGRRDKGGKIRPPVAKAAARRIRG